MGAALLHSDLHAGWRFCVGRADFRIAIYDWGQFDMVTAAAIGRRPRFGGTGAGRWALAHAAGGLRPAGLSWVTALALGVSPSLATLGLGDAPGLAAPELDDVSGLTAFGLGDGPSVAGPDLGDDRQGIATEAGIAMGLDAEARHRPVMLAEALEWQGVRAGGVYVDGTLGEGGHTLGILERSEPDGVVLGIDRDPRSVAVSRRRLEGYGERAMPVHGNYADMVRIAGEYGIAAVDGILLDLGFSSRQVELDGYGFSFQRDEPLDMRYDPVGETAADIVNTAGETELADVIYQYGEERRSRAIARAIVNGRPIDTTGQLADVVARAVGGRRGGRHPATRTFQALRIAVNKELEQLQAGLAAATELLAPGGRLVAISYHSLEDRLVKEWIDRETATCVCPPELPVCVCEHQPRLRATRRRIARPSEEEQASNPRSRSARLRAVERI